MNAIIQELKNSYIADEPLGTDSDLYYSKNYPIKIVHERTRVKEENILKELESIEFFDADGFSKNILTKDEIAFIEKNAANYIQTVSYALARTPFQDTYTFKEKFPHDRWKKIVNNDNIIAVLEESSFHVSQEICEIETQLRDIMRSRKEVPALKPIGFIWLAKVNKSTDITPIMQHYFLDDFIVFEKNNQKIYIGWNQKLQNINMRYFVCTPK